MTRRFINWLLRPFGLVLVRIKVSKPRPFQFDEDQP